MDTRKIEHWGAVILLWSGLEILKLWKILSNWYSRKWEFNLPRERVLCSLMAYLTKLRRLYTLLDQIISRIPKGVNHDGDGDWGTNTQFGHFVSVRLREMSKLLQQCREGRCWLQLGWDAISKLEKQRSSWKEVGIRFLMLKARRTTWRELKMGGSSPRSFL